MKILLDTHLLLWAANQPSRLPAAAAVLINDPKNELMFSAASIWEVAIKSSQGRPTFTVDAYVLWKNLLQSAYLALPVTSSHAVATGQLPAIHKDPFDRILVAQAVTEGLTLLTKDRVLGLYPGPVRII
ncbi:type II toxin-antitoxin system VapC family toxin [Oxalobacteraceae bacterium A2-2]